MSETIVALTGTPQGAQLALILALVSAFAHAAFGALQKGRHDPWLTRGAIDLWLAVLSAPVALILVPWPSPWVWGFLAGAVGLHLAYKLTMALAYERAPYTVVYPVVRGTGPLITLGFAIAVLGESYAPLQWLGVAALSGGILALSGVNLHRPGLGAGDIGRGIAWALAAGVAVAAYTTWDALGIRAAADPFTFLAWFFLVTALDFPLIAAWRWRQMAPAARPAPGPLMLRGLVGALVAWVSFGGVTLATRLDKVGEAAVLRETSTLFAALIGWAVLGERVGPLRAALMALIAAGAVLVEFGGRAG
ncbi:MAG: EamA family transporter [Rhodobacterales bacterium]|nr:EamA family transporter [Rhodobacterales bacterium]